APAGPQQPAPFAAPPSALPANIESAPSAVPQPVSKCYSPAPISVQPTASLRERCLAAQKARLAACAKQSTRERANCEAGAKALMTQCELINPQADTTAYRGGIAQGAARVCGVKACSVEKPCTDPTKPKGKKCTGGEVCVKPGAVCDKTWPY